jgi:mannose-6-phosphate isomerase-like protein (cupin superfamily)
MMECESYIEEGTTFAYLRFRTTLTMNYVHSKETPLMKYPVALAAILSTAALATAASFPQRVHYIDHDKVAAAFVKGGRIIEDQGLIVIAQRVVGRGSEMHDDTNHVFIIMDGEAEFITGGKLVDSKATAPGQTRGTGIEGGVSHHLTKGDVITIPAKTPHQWKDTSKTGSIGYYAVNFETPAHFPPGVRYIDHDKVAAAFVKGGRILEDQGLIVIANRGMQRGAEMHDNTNHVFIIMDGEAEFITGGKMVNPKVTDPGQTRGTGIEGGVSHHLTKGDVVTIPAKTPHQWKDTSKTGSVGYFAVNLASN